uniref:Diadenosine tetraphosphate (Ap4A) hydrolase and other HIT family hydrolases n=1 Tax=uncultured Thiotrichaceae bacterium TaxID=298394 RepID=A0A6S6TJ98_9GAMM|nr:MAG: Diadenosine tetraphosphate (Ap4A) hydrolase and other HIT family hydrolases [uncultured Thiotrichaceae bacterium]
MSFELHQQLAADCFEVGDLPLCHVLLANDARYPWFILVPRRVAIKEIHQLGADDRQQLWLESDWFSHQLEQLFSPDKLNIASLGNMVPQLHVHHIARFKTDDAWPAPVWGKFPAQPYEDNAEKRIEQIRAKLVLFPAI